MITPVVASRLRYDWWEVLGLTSEATTCRRIRDCEWIQFILLGYRRKPQSFFCLQLGAAASQPDAGVRRTEHQCIWTPICF
ncbi:MAG: hypothetical protein KDB03_28665 [Planctomycetales bacterium]|nr:hypothetical protein [Planctomycetales bacterium]